MDRRHFLLALLAGSFAAPLAAAVTGEVTAAHRHPDGTAFGFASDSRFLSSGVGKPGWIENQTVTVLELRSTEGCNERLPELAAEGRQACLRVIVADGITIALSLAVCDGALQNRRLDKHDDSPHASGAMEILLTLPDERLILRGNPLYVGLDDTLGVAFGDRNGERVAVTEFNARHEMRQLSPIHGLKNFVSKPWARV